jgi:Flp pilus assembly protein TadB
VELILVLLVLAAAAAVISSPLWWRTHRDDAENAELEALKAAKATKLSEIRDMELDYRIGKLSEDDYHALDRQLREEAVDLLHRLDAAQAVRDRAGR